MQNDLIIKAAQRDDFHALALWLVDIGQVAQQQCLHTWSGESADELREALLSYWDDGELCYFLALEDGKIVGAMGSEFDEQLGRAWLHGPHAHADGWQSVAQALYARLLAGLPAGIRQFDAYLNIHNKRAQGFYLEQGYEAHDSLNYDFWLMPEDRVRVGEANCVVLGREHEDAFMALYANLFPNTYYSGERIIQMIGDSHQVMVIAEGAEVLGFVVTSTTGEASPGEIQFLGVQAERRRRNYGRRLLLAGIDWLFDEAEAPRVCLNVGQDLIYAQALYESVGFKLRFTGVGLRKIL